MGIHRVALIYDDSARPETTGVYCRRALEQLVEVEHFRPRQLESLAESAFDLYLNVDDGIDYQLPSRLRPSAWWAIDTHLNFSRCLDKALRSDLVFAAQRDGTERLRDEGIERVEWLPLACDPDIHRKHEVERTQDIAFVGNVFPGPRADLIESLRRRFPSVYVGNAYFEAMARVYSASCVVFNRSVRNDVNMRVFEALACGSLLLTNELAANGQAELFRDGVHLATYHDAEELVDKTAYYLKHDDARERIAAAGHAEVRARHTYRQRMAAVLNVAERTAARTVVNPGIGAAVPPLMNGYYDFDRPELLALIPPGARRILDVGCGTGRLGAAAKARQRAAVVGIELCTEAAERAQARLDRVLIGDVERIDPGFSPAQFDCVVCGDILEHLRDPESFVKRVRSWLDPQGALVASMPNVRHHSVVSSLLEGNWSYEAAGLLDETHLTFFTRRDMVDLFERNGFRVADLRVIPGPGYEDWKKQGCPGEVKTGSLHISGITPEEAEEYFVYQYLLVLSQDDRSDLSGHEDLRTVGDLKPNEGLEPSQRPAGGGSRMNPATTRPRRTGRMRFTQDFLADFDQFDFHGPAFAFVRFADGERAICRGVPVVNCDGWRYDGAASAFAADLNRSLTYDGPDYYIGISDGCCDREARDWFLERIRAPRDRITFSNIFVNGNYRRFRRLDLAGTVVVASTGGHFAVPEHIINTSFDIDILVGQLLSVDRPILVAAGPASCVIIHKYWQRAPKRQVIVDVGSALDEALKGRKTRGYHYAGSPTSDKICQW